jgi:extracellular factor (EF) 3-hydroxypalmitic acid methyl ester biosynthesis protein
MPTVMPIVTIALDDFVRDCTNHAVAVSMANLVAALGSVRKSMPPGEWRESCRVSPSHPGLLRLLEDPYSRDARQKPFGYAGDARTLDYVYLRDPGAGPVSDLGRALFNVATSTPVAAAVRERSVLIQEAIADLNTRGGGAITTIACGHARELDGLGQASANALRFWGMDQDARSIARCQTRFTGRATSFHVGSVRDVLTGKRRLAPARLIYASGLFDYLEPRAGALLVKRMFGALEPGGSLLVPNLTPANDEIAYMEAIMDWWMVYRTEAEMRQLAAAAHLGPSASAQVFSTSQGRVAWLRVDRND